MEKLKSEPNIILQKQYNSIDKETSLQPTMTTSENSSISIIIMIQQWISFPLRIQNAQQIWILRQPVINRSGTKSWLTEVMSFMQPKIRVEHG